MSSTASLPLADIGISLRNCIEPLLTKYLLHPEEDEEDGPSLSLNNNTSLNKNSDNATISFSSKPPFSFCFTGLPSSHSLESILSEITEILSKLLVFMSLQVPLLEGKRRCLPVEGSIYRLLQLVSCPLPGWILRKAELQEKQRHIHDVKCEKDSNVNRYVKKDIMTSPLLLSQSNNGTDIIKTPITRGAPLSSATLKKRQSTLTALLSVLLSELSNRRCYYDAEKGVNEHMEDTFKDVVMPTTLKDSTEVVADIAVNIVHNVSGTSQEKSEKNEIAIEKPIDSNLIKKEENSSEKHDNILSHNCSLAYLIGNYPESLSSVNYVPLPEMGGEGTQFSNVPLLWSFFHNPSLLPGIGEVGLQNENHVISQSRKILGFWRKKKDQKEDEEIADQDTEEESDEQDENDDTITNPVTQTTSLASYDPTFTYLPHLYPDCFISQQYNNIVGQNWCETTRFELGYEGDTLLAAGKLPSPSYVLSDEEYCASIGADDNLASSFEVSYLDHNIGKNLPTSSSSRDIDQLIKLYRTVMLTPMRGSEGRGTQGMMTEEIFRRKDGLLRALLFSRRCKIVERSKRARVALEEEPKENNGDKRDNLSLELKSNRHKYEKNEDNKKTKNGRMIIVKESRVILPAETDIWGSGQGKDGMRRALTVLERIALHSNPEDFSSK